MKSEEFKKIINTQYKLFEQDINKIILFYSKRENISAKEGVLTDDILKIGKYKKINEYIFIEELGAISRDLPYNKGIFLPYKELEYINKINYSSAVELLAIVEIHIPNLIKEIISYNKKLIKNSNHKLNLSSKDIFSLTQHDILKKDSNKILFYMLSYQITQDLLLGKKKMLKKISKLIGINYAPNEKKFQDFIEIRNLVAHNNGIVNHNSTRIMDQEIPGYFLYLKSDNILKIAKYLLTVMGTPKDRVINKYSSNKSS